MPKDCLDKLESFTNILRNILFIFGSIVVIFIVITLFPQIRSQIKSARIESMEIAGIIKLNFKLKELNLYNKLNIPERVKGKEEIKVTKPVKEAAELINYKGTFWIYLGATTPRGSKGNWLTKYFNIVTVPARGIIIEAIADVFKRAEEPKIKEGEWMKGEIQGVVKRGEKIKVIDVVEIPGTRNRSLWWAKVLSP